MNEHLKCPVCGRYLSVNVDGNLGIFWKDCDTLIVNMRGFCWNNCEGVNSYYRWTDVYKFDHARNMIKEVNE